MDNSTGAHIGSTQRPTAKYSALTNSLRVLTTGAMQCSMFCGGKGCKYDNPAKWSDDQMAIKGLFSHWVTKRILAMSRPSTDAVKKFDIIKQFKEQGIKAVINLQTPGEHAHCGLGLEPGGFSYDQQEFMDNDIFFYNFGWDDYGVKSLTFILDMVKVMSFAVKEGKVAVHCHAGLGRTGVLIACYLIYAKRFDGDHAIHFVREKRPGSIQTKGQVECCQQFAQFLIPLRVVFSSCDPCSYPFTLQQFINRQKHVLHGFEARELKHIPKIVKLVCVRLHDLAKVPDVHSSSCLGLGDQDTLDVIKKSSPGAFHDTRPTADGQAPDPREGRRDRRSASLANGLDPSAATDKGPHQPPMGSKSPMLDLRKMHLNSDRISSSEDDAQSLGGRRRGRLTTSHSADSLGPSLGGASRVRTSASLLTNASLMNVQEARDVEVVADALSYALRGGSSNMEDDDSDEEEEQEEEGETLEVDSRTRAGVMHLKQRVESLQHNLNQTHSAWKIVATEEDPFVLAALMWSWLEQLKEPVLQTEDIEKITNSSECTLKALSAIEKPQRLTVQCILDTLAGLRPLSRSMDQMLIGRFTNAIAHKPTGECESDLLRFAAAYIKAFRETLPAVASPEKSDLTTTPPHKLPERTGLLQREGSDEKKKKKGKGKKKRDKSPGREKMAEARREREDGSGSSGEDQPVKLLVPKKRGSALPPIF